MSDVVFLLFRFHKIYNMQKITMVLASLLVLALDCTAVMAASKGNKTHGAYDWTPVMEAIIQVESRGDANARSGHCVGAMQITPALVAECNEVLKRRGSKKRFTLADRYSIAKSKEMFVLLQSAYNPQNNVEKAIRSWNGGNHYSVRKTQRYYVKVMKVLKKK